MAVFIAYRRTGGVCALLTFVAVALAAMVLSAAVAATLLVAALAIGAVALVARAVLPGRVPQRTPSTAWPHETLEGTVVDSPVEPNRVGQR